MGRKQEEGLTVKVPSFFRCPISLDVMKSPVSLCTGVTYDRSSIQRWLDSGNNTCPATMQPLPSTDLVPNLTLRRLITLWAQTATTAAPVNLHALLLDEIQSSSSSSNPSPSLLRKLSSFLDNSDIDELDKNNLIEAGGCAELLGSLIRNNNNLVQLETMEEAVTVAKKILDSDCIDKENKEILISTISSWPAISSLILVLKEGKSTTSRVNAAVVINALMLKRTEIRFQLSERNELIPELIRLVGEERAGIDAGLSCLVSLSGVKRTRVRMVRSGIVPVLTRIISEDAKTVAASTAAEKAMKLMEVASECTDGREAICENAKRTIPAILQRMMKVGREGTEAATVVLWCVCHLFRDRRAQEALVAAANGGLTKILLLMQSDCSAAAREMAGDLLRVFRVNSKCRLGGYDTKTAHIMPF